MCRRDQHGVGVKAVDEHPVAVHRLRHHLEAVCLHTLPRRGLGRILSGDAGGAARVKHAHEQIDTLGRPLDNHDLARVGDDAARSAEMIGEHLA